MLKVLQKICTTPEYIKCYLCQENVKEKHWINGSHRFQCMKKHKTRFETFLEHPTLCCPKCERKLRLWTDQGTLFVCNSDISTCKANGSTRENSKGNRYSCFVCDFDLCLECKTVWEERQVAKRAKAERKLRRNIRLSRAEVSNVVCLKTLCDTVAQIENARRNKKCVSVGVNTEPDTSAAEGDSSEDLTLIGRDVSCDTEMYDLTPTDPNTFPIMAEETRGHNGDLSEHKDDLDHSEDVMPGEECRVEVHLTNGHLTHSEPDLVTTNGPEFNHDKAELSDDQCDTNHNYKKTQLMDQIRDQPPCSCSIPDSILARLKLRGRAESLLSMSESPDIFHLRAPLVSMENMFTPSISDDSLLAEF